MLVSQLCSWARETGALLGPFCSRSAPWFPLQAILPWVRLGRHQDVAAMG